MGFKMTIAAPQSLHDSECFKNATKATRDNLVLFCTVVLMYGGVDTLDRQFQQITWERLSRFIRGKTIRSIRQQLVKAGIIECDDQFSYRKSGSEKSLGYRFGPSVFADDFFVYELKSKWAKDRIEAAENEVQKSYLCQKGTFAGIHSRLTAMMGHFQLDLQESQSVIAKLPVYKRPSAEHQLSMFYYQQFYAVVGSTGRFYSNLSNLRKELRGILKAKVGESLIETVTPDVSCCQPVCLNHFLRDEISSTEFKIHLELTETGQLYSKIATDIGRTRQQVKASFVKYLCGPSFDGEPTIQKQQLADTALREKHETLNLIGEWYRDSLPETNAYLKRIKEDPANGKLLNANRTGKQKKQAFAIVANKLQKLESSIVIDHCCPLLLKKHPELSIATIHDGILCPEDYESAVAEQLSRSFKAYGLSPKISTEKKHSSKQQGITTATTSKRTHRQRL